MKLIKQFGEFWQRREIFDVRNGRVTGTDRGWPDQDPPLDGARGVYVLYRGSTPVYVGKGLISVRLRQHAQGWLSHAWDNVTWFQIDNDDVIDAVEAILITTLRTSLNGVLPGSRLGKRRYPGNDRNFARNTLWTNTGPQP